MQNLNYNQKQTALLLGQRNSVVQPTIGDVFAAVYDYTTVAEYNAMRTWYIAAVNDITALFAWNTEHSTSFVVNGRDEDNNIYPINDAPTDPFPIPPPKT